MGRETTRAGRGRWLLPVLIVTLAGCGASSPVAGGPVTGPSVAATSHPIAAASGTPYWTLKRLAAVQPEVNGPRGDTGESHPATGPEPRVGALFSHDLHGNHFCTASVVDSRHGDVVMTAAHCLAGQGGTPDVVFVPGYRSGTAPDGTWAIKQVIVDPRWTASADPDLDVAFVVLQPRAGANAADVLGSFSLAFDTGASNRVRVTGYPDSSDAPITCSGRTTAFSPTQLRFVCAGYTSGTSGSPWFVRIGPDGRSGTVVGLIGGYEQGGDDPGTSYSPYFGDAVEALYDRARTAG